VYRAIFSRRAQKSFLDLFLADAQRVRDAIAELQQEPRGRQTIKLDHAPVAQYRRCVGNYRILFDLDDPAPTIEILDIRKRDEQTYR
jgi:mRNA-degrading endonuclease RelE of RelBE toxin-antitoxin system